MDNNEINSIILKIYEEQKNTNNKIDNMGQSIYGKIGEMQGQIGEMQGQIGKMQGQIGEMQGQINGMQKRIDGMYRRMDGIENKYDSLQGQVIKLQGQINEMQGHVNEIPQIKEELRKLSGRVAVIEKEHGEKLQILLDVVTGNTEKNKEIEKRIEKDEKIIDRHSDEIYYLKEKIETA